MSTWKNVEGFKCRKRKNDYDETKNEFVIFILNEETETQIKIEKIVN